jgi:hypothetical protein
MLKTVSTANGLVSPTFSGNVTLTDGNLIIGTSGKGIDFSATPGTGTSELLSDYEEGTWTPTDISGAGLTFTVSSNRYTKVGRMVTCSAFITFPTTVSAANANIGGFPFAAAVYSIGPQPVFFGPGGFATMAGGTADVFLRDINGATMTNVALSAKSIAISITYQA